MVDVIVAVDVGTRDEALEVVDRLAGEARFFKVGLELFVACGPEIVRELRRRDLRVFLDLKLHDIPTTVRRAARAASRLGADLLSIHASGGDAMVEAAREGVEGSSTRVLAVTALTSLSRAELADVWGRSHVDPIEEVTRLTALSLAAGAHGVVCSPREARSVRGMVGAGPLIVTPGIRPDGSPTNDQTRVMSPGEAVAAGADLLVVGRPVTAAPDPVAAYRQILRETRDAGVGAA